MPASGKHDCYQVVLQSQRQSKEEKGKGGIKATELIPLGDPARFGGLSLAIPVVCDKQHQCLLGDSEKCTFFQAHPGPAMPESEPTLFNKMQGGFIDLTRIRSHQATERLPSYTHS